MKTARTAETPDDLREVAANLETLITTDAWQELHEKVGLLFGLKTVIDRIDGLCLKDAPPDDLGVAVLQIMAERRAAIGIMKLPLQLAKDYRKAADEAQRKGEEQQVRQSRHPLGPDVEMTR